MYSSDMGLLMTSRADSSLMNKLVTREQLILIPTASTGWTTAVVGSGSVGSVAVNHFSPNTGITTGSQALIRTVVHGLSRGSTNHFRVDWTKKFLWTFSVTFVTANANVIAHVQLTQGTTHTDLAGRGLGIKFTNTAVTAESYDTALGSETFFTATASQTDRITIVNDPVAVATYFYRNGVLIVTQTTATKVPAAEGTGNTSFLVSIDNGAGTTDAQIRIGQIVIVQEI